MLTRSKLATNLTLGLFAVILSCTNAAASPSWMPTTGTTSQPVGHYEFCQQYPTACQPNAPALPTIAPPTVPGMPQVLTNPPRPCSTA